MEPSYPLPEGHLDISVSSIQEREPTAIKDLFEKVNPVLARMLSGSNIYGEKAEDIIQQTWETFFSNLDGFEGRSQVRTFVVGILINKIREFRRGSGRIVLEEDSEAVHSQSFTPEGWWKREPGTPEQFLVSRELEAHLKECIEGLNETQRSAFLMVEVEEQETPEICNVLGISATHLRVLLFRAKDKLRSCLRGKLAH